MALPLEPPIFLVALRAFVVVAAGKQRDHQDTKRTKRKEKDTGR